MRVQSVGAFIGAACRSMKDVVLAADHDPVKEAVVGRFVLLAEREFRVAADPQTPPWRREDLVVPLGTQLIVTDVIQPFGSLYPSLVVALFLAGPIVSPEDQFVLPHTVTIIA